MLSTCFYFLRLLFCSTDLFVTFPRHQLAPAQCWCRPGHILMAGLIMFTIVYKLCKKYKIFTKYLHHCHQCNGCRCMCVYIVSVSTIAACAGLGRISAPRNICCRCWRWLAVARFLIESLSVIILNWHENGHIGPLPTAPYVLIGF